MVESRDATRPSEVLAALTPDSRRWRLLLSGGAAVASVVLFYYTVLLISSKWTGTLPNLLVGVGAVLTLLSAAAVPTVLFAPRRSTTGSRDSTAEDDPVAVLKRRYAEGEIAEEEFEHRLEQLVSAPGEIDAEEASGDGATFGDEPTTHDRSFDVTR
ncbi:SHOCT domain-containing protein [Halorussus sp. MSC15.2]|uniref:SHOCT domain-containing protein n=1 Tax=Halorussus sp. MSC15.2 TaxID=2283638 RepID=UPI0013D7B089|nr:SHOCT domain-containing protein [Halorussus sp. MSC15.2]NEU55291.1 hypothetical protein [Halorussus sp. MSC15.2]